MNKLISKYPGVVLFGVCICMLLPHLGLIQTNIMECRNLVTAREMVQNDHWIFTTLNNIPRYEKPPLPTWITAIFGKVFGFHNMFFLRLPAAFATLLLIYFFYRLCKKVNLTANHSLNASLILITSFYIFFAGRDNQWDIYAHAFMMAGIYYLYVLFNDPNLNKIYIIPAGLFLGFSFLSKGPVSPYALMLPFILSCFIVYKNNLGKKIILLIIVLVLGLVAGLSWPLYIRYFDSANVSATLSKESGRWAGYEIKPFWYYWSFFTQSGIWTVPAFISLLYPYMKSRVSNLKAYRFSFLWTIFSVILLSVIPEKKSRYLLPVLIPLALNTSFYVQYLIIRFKEIRNRKELVSVYFSFGLIGIVALLFPLILFIVLKSKVSGYLLWVIGLSIISICCGLAILYGLKVKKFSNAFYAVILFMCGVVVFVIPISKAYYNNQTYYSAANLHDIESKNGIKTYEANGFEPEIIWDYGSAIPEINAKNILTLPAEPVFGLFINVDEENIFIAEMKNYSFNKIATVDLNDVGAGEKRYNKRLVKNYYLVKKNATNENIFKDL